VKYTPDSEHYVQTRSEEHGLLYFLTVFEAMEHAAADLTVWKISFETIKGERIRLVKDIEANNMWGYEPIETFLVGHISPPNPPCEEEA